MTMHAQSQMNPGDDVPGFGEYLGILRKRRRLLLTVAMPMVRDLVGGATGDDLVVAVSDDVGRLLWVEGRGPVRAAVVSHGRLKTCASSTAMP